MTWQTATYRFNFIYIQNRIMVQGKILNLTELASIDSLHDYLQFGRMDHPVVGPNDSGKKLWHFSMAPPTQRSVKARGGHPNLGFCTLSSKGVSHPHPPIF